MTEVSQRARAAAAPSFPRVARPGVLVGTYDADKRVQAFARFEAEILAAAPAEEAGLREALEQADYVLSVAVEETTSDTLRTYLIREKARFAAALQTSAPGGGK